MWESVWGNVISWAIIGAIVVASAWLWQRRRRPIEAVAAAKSSKARAVAGGALEAARADVLARAAELGVPVAVKKAGASPVVVTWSDNSQSFHWGSHTAYTRAMGPPPRTNPQRSWPGHGPKTVGQMTLVELETWLLDHPAPK